MKKMVRRFFCKTFIASFIVGGFSFVATIVLQLYSFVEYSDSYFTTSPNFVPLDKAAPTLSTMMIYLLIVLVVAFILCYISYSIVKKLTKRHR